MAVHADISAFTQTLQLANISGGGRVYENIFSCLKTYIALGEHGFHVYEELFPLLLPAPLVCSPPFPSASTRCLFPLSSLHFLWGLMLCRVGIIRRIIPVRAPLSIRPAS